MFIFCFVLGTRFLNLLCLVFFVFGSYVAKSHVVQKVHQNKEDNDKNNIGKKWVVLVSGSDGWYNYRHQVFIKKIFKILLYNNMYAYVLRILRILRK